MHKEFEVVGVVSWPPELDSELVTVERGGDVKMRVDLDCQ